MFKGYRESGKLERFTSSTRARPLDQAVAASGLGAALTEEELLRNLRIHCVKACTWPRAGRSLRFPHYIEQYVGAYMPGHASRNTGRAEAGRRWGMSYSIDLSIL
jgi:hypothetical protein